MQWVGSQLVAGLLAAVLSLLAEQCWAEGGDPSLAERVIWAVNAGGEAHVDVHGIHFRKDPLEGKVGKGESWLYMFKRSCVDPEVSSVVTSEANEESAQRRRAPPFSLEVKQVLI